MRKLLPVVTLALVAAGCARSDQSAFDTSPARASASRTAMQNVRPTGALASIRSRLAHGERYASLPDRGELLTYTAGVPATRTQAYTWKQARLSEQHALNAIGGTMTVESPDGRLIRLRYDHYIEHPNGDWTWVGRPAGAQPGTEAVITFGRKAVFGSIPDGRNPPLRLMQANGVSWMVQTDAAALASIPGAHPTEPDALPVPDLSRRAVSDGAMRAGDAPAIASATAAVASTTVDLVLGYTNYFATRLGGQSQANTRLNNIVDFANQAYINSGIDARVRLVNTLQVDYTDNSDNDQALYDITGYDCSDAARERNNDSCERRTVPASLQPLLNARDQYGADLVSLVRAFDNSTNNGCGVGWLLGSGQKAINNSDAPFGYSVVSDSNGKGPGSFPSNGYVCRDETLVHELGHNMGGQHDVATAKGSNNTLEAKEYGRYPYSFGYKTGASNGNFYTIMAYGDSGQTAYRIFSNPRTAACGGLACGTAQADNAQTLAQTMPVVAGFRATIMASYSAPNILAIGKLGASGRTELHRLTSASNFQLFDQHIASALGNTGQDFSWRMLSGDYNRDGVKDIVAIGRAANSSRTEIHVLNGADGYQTFLAHIATALGRTGNAFDWDFLLADYNQDGVLDLYCIYKMGAKTEIHVLNGADAFQTFLLHTSSVMGMAGSDGAWMFGVGDWNGDSRPDLFAIGKIGGSGFTEVHILDGATTYQTYLLNRATALGPTGSTYQWSFLIGDADGDGVLDLYSIYRGGASRTELHILNGATQFSSFSFHGVTGLSPVTDNGAWEFQLVN